MSEPNNNTLSNSTLSNKTLSNNTLSNNESDNSTTMRLQKFLARAGVASRRASEELICQGRVSVNGEVVTELGTKVDPAHDVVMFDNHPVRLEQDHIYLMLNKPAGYLTTMSDPFNRPTVADLVPVDTYPGLFPVGRLDQDTTGLLLFTTDGELGNILLHPRHHVDKCYEVWVKGILSDTSARKLCEGVDLEDGRTAPADVRLIKRDKQHHQTHLLLTIHEGRKRQVKRMCEAVGNPVVRLHRRSFGPLALGDLTEGSFCLLDDKEVSALTNL